MMRKEKIVEYALTAIKAAVVAGETIMDIYGDPQESWDVEFKSDSSPLTRADKEANRIITDTLMPTGLNILSEEGQHLPYEARKDWHRLWVVDPLDGTKEFIKKNGEFTVNIALVEDGVPMMGVIYVPAQEILYYGVVGMGAWMLADFTTTDFDLDWDKLIYASLRMPIEVGDGPQLSVAASRSHLNEETKAYVDKLRAKYDKVEFKQAGSSLKICLVAKGEADVYPRLAPTMEWDTAAGHAILKAAGGEMYQYSSRMPLEYNKPELRNPSFVAVLSEDILP